MKFSSTRIILTNSRQANKLEDGFTLVEVLVTLVIVSFMFISMLSFFTQFRKMNELSRSVSEQNEVEALTNFLERSIGNAKLLPLIEYGFQNPRYLRGYETSIEFVSESRRGSEALGLFDVTLKWIKSDKSIVEFRKARRSKHNDNLKETKISLIDNVTDLNVSYALIEDTSGPIKWIDDWNLAQSFPNAIRVRGEVKQSQKAHNFEFIINMKNNRRAY